MVKENDMTDAPATEAQEIPGAFLSTLIRSNSKIKRDRAVAIAEDLQMTYKRQVEDITIQIKRLKRDQESQLDLSPETALGLVPAKNFDPLAWADKDLELGVQIRNEEIRLEIAQKRYDYLFGTGK